MGQFSAISSLLNFVIFLAGSHPAIHPRELTSTSGLRITLKSPQIPIRNIVYTNVSLGTQCIDINDNFRTSILLNSDHANSSYRIQTYSANCRGLQRDVPGIHPIRNGAILEVNKRFPICSIKLDHHTAGNTNVIVKYDGVIVTGNDTRCQPHPCAYPSHLEMSVNRTVTLFTDGNCRNPIFENIRSGHDLVSGTRMDPANVVKSFKIFAV